MGTLVPFLVHFSLCLHAFLHFAIGKTSCLEGLFLAFWFLIFLIVARRSTLVTLKTCFYRNQIIGWLSVIVVLLSLFAVLIMCNLFSVV